MMPLGIAKCCTSEAKVHLVKVNLDTFIPMEAELKDRLGGLCIHYVNS